MRVKACSVVLGREGHERNDRRRWHCEGKKIKRNFYCQKVGSRKIGCLRRHESGSRWTSRKNLCVWELQKNAGVCELKPVACPWEGRARERNHRKGWHCKGRKKRVGEKRYGKCNATTATESRDAKKKGCL
jgi:hypothetical protein